MDHDVSHALRGFTQRYVELWRQERDHAPASQALFGVPSPCIVGHQDDKVLWLPQPFTPAATLEKVETALGLRLQSDAQCFYTQQYAGDIHAQFGVHRLRLLQVWSEDDFIRLQENLIGHLVAQKRLKLSPTLFLATTESEMTLVSLCNGSGNVVLEQVSSDKRLLLAATLENFLDALRPTLGKQ
ncbi:SecY-interacting protein [Serratia symbiotica]|uniref:SecY-interacting protein n=1 Tax=Serratia symbiotica TaxID=138074 RepID=UPI001D3292FC|nr:SecY-interacting protein [Serratia symbiotica]NIG87803.1 SecY-interacting protein [Serratia symbiotica]USS95203.1 SecY-interacting protein [Serratia symbiotica]